MGAHDISVDEYRKEMLSALRTKMESVRLLVRSLTTARNWSVLPCKLSLCKDLIFDVGYSTSVIKRNNSLSKMRITPLLGSATCLAKSKTSVLMFALSPHPLSRRLLGITSLRFIIFYRSTSLSAQFRFFDTVSTSSNTIFQIL